MQIPDNFKNKIAEVFYDKEITIYEVTNTVDDEGFAYRTVEATEDTFLSNVRFDKLDEVREEYGIKEDIDIVISTHEAISNGAILSYLDVLYIVIRSIPYDSHNLLIAKKWQSSQSELSV